MKAFMGLNFPAEEEYTDIYTYDPNKVFVGSDWASKMAAVKNQGQCGSCWAFSAVAATEGRYHLTYKKKDKVDVTFSEQQLVDCDKKSAGCNGGWMDNAFDLFKDGFMKEDDYKYTAQDGTCKFDANKKVDSVKGRTSIIKGDVAGLISASEDGPVSVAVDATNMSGYISGLFSDCSNNLNHGVTLVGVDTNTVWKVRNSWGASWGEAGHIRIKRGNTCGIANAASYPTF